MLLGYQESHRSLPWDEDLACIIRRCSAASSERWPMALRHLMMTDRDRAKSRRSRRKWAWLVSLACDKAKEHGYPHELWTTRLLARHARERGPAAGHQCLARLAQGTVCKLLGQEEIKPHKVRYYLEPRRRVRAQDGGSSVCLPRGPGPEKAAAKAEKSKKPVAIVSYDEKPGIKAIATTAPDFPPVPGRHAGFARDHEYKRHGARSACWPGSICSPARSTRSSGSATAAASSSNSSSFSMPPIRPAPRSS